MRAVRTERQHFHSPIFSGRLVMPPPSTTGYPYVSRDSNGKYRAKCVPGRFETAYLAADARARHRGTARPTPPDDAVRCWWDSVWHAAWCTDFAQPGTHVCERHKQRMDKERAVQEREERELLQALKMLRTRKAMFEARLPLHSPATLPAVAGQLHDGDADVDGSAQAQRE